MLLLVLLAVAVAIAFDTMRAEEETTRQIERVVQREMYLWPNNTSTALTFTNYS